MFQGLIIEGHNSLNLTSLLLLYIFVNILYIWTLFLLLNTFWQEWSWIITLFTNYSILSILTCILSLWLFLIQPNTTSHILTLFTSGLLILLLNTFCHEWSRIIRLCKEFQYIFSFNVYTLSKTLFDTNEHNLSVSHFRYIWTLFLLLNTFWQELSCLVSPCNEFLYIISLDVYTVSKTFFDAT
jgi:hypothetical protein